MTPSWADAADGRDDQATAGPSRHRANPSSHSTSSYAAVLIHPAPMGQTSPPVERSITPLLRYPYPLPITSILDLAYILHRQLTPTGDTPAHLFVAAAAGTRCAVLAGVVGCSTRWRSRGGWVAAACGISVGAAVWEDCKERLGRVGPGVPDGAGAGGGGAGQGHRVLGGQTLFLYTTVLICLSEYVLFLLLLRLSPPPHRSHPLSLRVPGRPHQTDVPFAFASEDADIDIAHTPRSVRFRRYSARSARSPLAAVSPRDPRLARGADGRRQRPAGVWPSADNGSGRARRTDASASAEVAFGMQEGTSDTGYAESDVFGAASSRRGMGPRTSARDEDERELSDDESQDEYGSPDSDSGYISESTVSDSSIIDLPPPLGPQRIIPPSMSMQGNMSTISLAGRALDASPILGAVMRRSRSARFLPRSWGSERGLRMAIGATGGGGVVGAPEGRAADSEEAERGYGTFGS